MIAVDINPAAVRNTRENVRLHHLERKIVIFEGDIYGPIKNKKFDTIFWNTPFGYTENKELTHLEKATFDYEYKSTKRFIVEAKNHLNSDGKLLIGFSSTLGHWDELQNILKSAGYKFRVLRQISSTEVHPVKFELIEASLK